MIVAVIVLVLLGFVAVSIVGGNGRKVLRILGATAAALFVIPLALVALAGACYVAGPAACLLITLFWVAALVTVLTLDLTPGGVLWMLLDAAYKAWKQKNVHVLGCGHEHLITANHDQTQSFHPGEQTTPAEPGF